MEKRKYAAEDGEIAGKRGKAVVPVEDHGGEKVAEDDEVEEFFAILRRIQVAVKYFENRDGGTDRELTPAGWKPSFKREDFEEFNGVKKDKQIGEENHQHNQNVGFDLNSNPSAEPEQNASDSSVN